MSPYGVDSRSIPTYSEGKIPLSYIGDCFGHLTPPNYANNDRIGQLSRNGHQVGFCRLRVPSPPAFCHKGETPSLLVIPTAKEQTAFVLQWTVAMVVGLQARSQSRTLDLQVATPILAPA